MLKESLITIVTPVYNAEKSIKKTIESVICQEYASIEFIIVDGDSNDSTLSIASQYLNRGVSRLISEKDYGMYDAINKGIKHATGTYILVLNAGDSFVSRETISKVGKEIVGLGRPEGVVFGTAVYTLNGHVLEGWYWPPGKNYVQGMSPHHQCAFVSRKIYEKYLYDSRFKIAGDNEFWHRIRFYEKVPFHYIDIEVSYFELGGMSNRVDSQIDRYIENAVISYFYSRHPKRAFLKRLLLNMLKYSVRSFVYIAFGKSFYYKVLRLRNRVGTYNPPKA